MLVLNRAIDEVVVIGGQNGQPPIRVMVVEIRGDKVRLGVEAPSEIPVHRQEVYEAIRKQGEAA